MKPWRCKHGYEIGFEPVEPERTDDAMIYRIKWKYCGICCNEIANRQIAAMFCEAGPAVAKEEK